MELLTSIRVKVRGMKMNRTGKHLQITSEIYQVGGGDLTHGEDAAIYLLNFEGHGALVDAGCGHTIDQVMANIESCGMAPSEIEWILITHCHFDHTGGVKTLKDRLGGKVVGHALDAPFLEQGDNRVTAATWYGSAIQPFTVDRKLSSAREEIQIGDRMVIAVHTPGHSPGSVVYLAESDGLKVLFGQDVHGPLHPSLLSNRADYLRSLALMISLDADILCEGHYGIMKGKRKVREFIHSFEES
jgi:glyoxylase-like metal-dependent hydrolase (beta-lactamase superfamily II)